MTATSWECLPDFKTLYRWFTLGGAIFVACLRDLSAAEPDFDDIADSFGGCATGFFVVVHGTFVAVHGTFVVAHGTSHVV
jgi:hypothetical protein